MSPSGNAGQLPAPEADRKEGTKGDANYVIPVPDDEEELMEAIACGNQHAFGKLALIHAPHVWRVVLRVLRNRDDADDVTQEALLRLWSRAAQWSPDRGTVRV